MLVIPPGFAQIAIEIRNEFDPDSWFTTFGITLANAEGDILGTCEGAVSAFVSAYQIENLSNQCTIVGGLVKIGQDGGPPVTIYVPRGDVGHATAEMLPQNCAALVSKQTNRGGRPGKGRMFLPGMLPEGQVSQTGIISNTALSNLQTNTTNFLLNLSGGSMGDFPNAPMYLLHNDTAPGGTDPDEVLSLNVDSKISTQRRRLR